jgi:hypothetical protein
LYEVYGNSSDITVEHPPFDLPETSFARIRTLRRRKRRSLENVFSIPLSDLLRCAARARKRCSGEESYGMEATCCVVLRTRNDGFAL